MINTSSRKRSISVRLEILEQTTRADRPKWAAPK